MEITKEFLISNGWRLKRDNIWNNLPESDRKELLNEGYGPTEDYEIDVCNQSNGDKWFITMRYDLSNTLNRDWACHIDNNTCESVAYVDIGTVDQFNKLMDLMEIEYRL